MPKIAQLVPYTASVVPTVFTQFCTAVLMPCNTGITAITVWLAQRRYRG